MNSNNKKFLKITFTLKNCNIEKVQLIELIDDATEEQIKTYIAEMKNKIKYAMECSTILSSMDDDDFVLIDGDSIAYVKCECTNSGNVEKE
ncbi:hypothetical protein DW886_14765 [Enterocloster aldenensis]|uniref:hypothetical protein n=1 Tax=Enterocloster aldenensis TaxID=358742 RepID=UPI000E4832FD|nr:hypothetical protein DW886_14765 [Enterocloster aldenensis]